MALVPLDVVAACKALGLEEIHHIRDEVWALCPGHLENVGRRDSKPTNFSVNTRTGVSNCFSCGFAKDSFAGLVTYVRQCDGFEANRWIRRFGISLDAVDELPASLIDTKPDTDRLPMTESRLTVFDPPPDRELDKRDLTREAVERYGVLWEKERRAWIIPIRMGNGTLLGWQIKGKGIFRNYPVSVPVSETLFGLQALSKGETAVLVESPLDVVRLASVGVSGGVATWTANYTAEQMRLLLSVTGSVVVAMDNDPAGRSAAKSLKRDWARKFDMSFLAYKHTDAKDIGEMTRREIMLALEYSEHSALARV